MRKENKVGVLQEPQKDLKSPAIFAEMGFLDFSEQLWANLQDPPLKWHSKVVVIVQFLQKTKRMMTMLNP